MGGTRQNNGSSGVDSTSIASAALATHKGQVAQVAYWRNAAGQGLRVKSTGGGTTLATLTAGSNNTGDFSAKTPRWGNCASLASGSLPDNGTPYRLFRGFIEDQRVRPRPAATLDADWTTVASRFS